MDEHALRVLEFDKVLGRLSRLAAFSGGRDLALALTPSSDYEVVLERQRLLADAARLRSFRPALNLNSATDIRGSLEKAGLGGSLDAQELLNVAVTQRVAQQAKGTLGRMAPSLPKLGQLAAGLHDKHHIVDEISKAIDGRGEVLDSASPALGIIRRDIKVAHDRLHSRLQEFLGSAAGRLAAQEPIVTLRDGRYVVPIKSDFRGEVRGIVHDVSSSGATLFVEPLVVVDLANRWRELQIEETREVERVLRHLSNIVGSVAPELAENVEALAKLDLLVAAARLGEELSPNGLPCMPDAESLVDPERWLGKPSSAILLNEARHPLIANAVPISLELGGESRVLLVTGPNTGGKTVALKTAGLLCLMAQAGLPVPAMAGTTLPVFADVLADIGDEQSIEQSLSTFSGHLRNVISILERAGPGTLVLLDELAAGTDPTEGAALARALLEHLLERGALTFATTHHGELKLFAHSTPGVVNAAVEFDSVTLAPTYRITMGIPGRSNALAIAARLGLPQSILESAQQSIAPDDQAIDSLLTELHIEREAAGRARQAEEQARRRTEQARDQVEQRLAGIDEERAKRLDDAALALENEVEAAREALARVQRLAARRENNVAAFTTTSLSEELGEAREAVQEAADAAKRLRKRSRRRRHSSGIQSDSIVPGSEVWVQGIPVAAEALSAPDLRGELEVSFGGLRARVGLGQIVRVERAPQRVAERIVLPPAPQTAVGEIEVRGQTLDEALPRVEQFLDDGFRAGYPYLRVIHGKGTGKMRNAVRDMLTKSPLVKSFQFADLRDGGEGVTVAEMVHS